MKKRTGRRTVRPRRTPAMDVHQQRYAIIENALGTVEAVLTWAVLRVDRWRLGVPGHRRQE